ncbi:tetratricopeptide repeat protein [Streptomyces sp. XM4193]|uniref:tetratricopeptide repeat protein n=1 Tax=Streptomyces sp. XM4193 TaxID=2929782 RepID=UPI001FFA9E1F|nr:tetratricopeptide repeat protein [Streptomyces sp. XM4193]MCK1795009.1 tetratricopeptide repeat protein [Streptomyces sp. XM4193]
MIEVVTVGAVSAVLATVGNGVSGGVSAWLADEVGARIRRTLGREVPLPADDDARRELARLLHARIGEDPGDSARWAAFLRSLPADDAVLRPLRPLPPSTPWFTDRRAVLARLSREASRPARGRPRVAQLDGPPGVGTSAAVLHWGALHGRRRFPDGQVYVDLRGAGGEHGPLPSVVLRRVLEAMGVPAGELPATEQGRADRYQQLIAGKRVLVVVDHVSSAAQVRSLVPAAPEPFLVVVRSGPPFALPCRRIGVPPLRDRDARRFLRKDARGVLARHRAEVPALLARCAGNAHALTAEKARLLTGAAPTADPPSGPSASAAPENPVQLAALRACAQLPPETVRLCRLVALADWPSIDAGLAAGAAGVSTEEAAAALAGAETAQLLVRLPEDRYRMNSEARAVLARVAAVEDGAAACSTAVLRMLDRLLVRARWAADAALPASWRVEHPTTGENPYADTAAGMAALLADLDGIVRAIVLADEYGRPELSLALARTLWPLQLKAGRWDEVLPALVFAARRADEVRPGTRTSAGLHFQVAHAHGELKQWQEADESVGRAAADERAAGHLLGEASCWELRGLLRLYAWRFGEAGEHLERAAELYARIPAGDPSRADVPRALALLDRHRGRALHGMGRPVEARARLERALAFFAPNGQGAEAYNRARVLTDLAATLLATGDRDRARTAVDEARGLLAEEHAAPHLEYLAVLRRNCEPPEPARPSAD